MSDFIAVKGFKDDDKVSFVRKSEIFFIGHSKAGDHIRTSIGMSKTPEYFLMVKESPEEILAMIEGEK